MAFIGNTPTQQAFTPAIDYFSGNGSTVAFALSRSVASAAQVQCVIENVPQNPTSAFTVSGNTITFTSAPPSGTNNIYVYYTSPITQVNALTQSPSIIGDVNASGGIYSAGTFNSAYADGVVLDYTTGTGRVTVGSSDGFKIRNGGPSSPTDLVTVDSSGNVGIGTSSIVADAKLVISKAGAAGLEFSIDNAVAGVNRVFSYNRNTNAAVPLYTHASYHYWGTNAGNQTMTLDASGNLLVGVSAWTDGGGGSFIGNRASAGINGKFSCSSTSNQVIFYFTNPNGVVGLIQASGSTTAYVTSSDYRLKENVQPMQNALGVVQQLKPCTYTWKADGSAGQGFIAHELAEVCPDAVAGEKDAVNEDGSIKPQGIDTSFLVATLTAAIQEQQAIIQQLTARIEALEAK